MTTWLGVLSKISLTEKNKSVFPLYKIPEVVDNNSNKLIQSVCIPGRISEISIVHNSQITLEALRKSHWKKECGLNSTHEEKQNIIP